MNKKYVSSLVWLVLFVVVSSLRAADPASAGEMYHGTILSGGEDSLSCLLAQQYTGKTPIGTLMNNGQTLIGRNAAELNMVWGTPNAEMAWRYAVTRASAVGGTPIVYTLDPKAFTPYYRNGRLIADEWVTDGAAAVQGVARRGSEPIVPVNALQRAIFRATRQRELEALFPPTQRTSNLNLGPNFGPNGEPLDFSPGKVMSPQYQRHLAAKSPPCPTQGAQPAGGSPTAAPGFWSRNGNVNVDQISNGGNAVIVGVDLLRQASETGPDDPIMSAGEAGAGTYLAVAGTAVGLNGLGFSAAAAAVLPVAAPAASAAFGVTFAVGGGVQMYRQSPSQGYVPPGGYRDTYGGAFWEMYMMPLGF